MKKELYLLTGFLGAGKTSLLLHLLNHVQERKIGIIQNEFGKLSIDGTSVTGAFSAASAPTHFTGPGVLRVLPKGTILLFR